VAHVGGHPGTSNNLCAFGHVNVCLCIALNLESLSHGIEYWYRILLTKWWLDILPTCIRLFCARNREDFARMTPLAGIC
jgi:hypothetical protein